MFLEIKDIKKTFGDNTVLNGCSFGIEKGEIVALLGVSGAGKTTMLKCLNFLETPDEGQIVIGNEVLFDAKRDANMSDKEKTEKRLHFGLVFQAFNLFPQYTVKENITLAPKLLKKESEVEINVRADELLETVGLQEKANAYPYELSGGQQQRVAIARALAMRPDILCFDEPTSALDPALVGEVVKVVKELKQQNCCILVVTHDMNFARRACDRIVFIADGNIEEDSLTADFFEHPKSKKATEFLSTVTLL